MDSMLKMEYVSLVLLDVKYVLALLTVLNVSTLVKSYIIVILV